MAPSGQTTTVGFVHSITIISPLLFLQLTPSEAKNIADIFRNPTSAFASGVTVGGVKFLVTRASEDTIAARKDARGLFLNKSNKVIVLAMHGLEMDAGTCSTHCGKASDYFKALGF